MFAKQTNDQLLISLVVLSANMHQIFHRNFVHSDELVNKWWESPNLAFEGKTPLEVFEIDRQDVIDYVLSYLQV